MSKFRRLMTLMIAILLAIPAGITLAQDASTPEALAGNGTAFAPGIGVPATTFDDRGNPTATIAVTDVLVDWIEYEVGMEPQSGMMYVVITYEFSNPTSRPMTAGIWQATLYDDFGLRAEMGYYWGSDEFTTDDISVDPGATAEAKVLYMMWADATPMMVTWEPDYSSSAFIYLGD